MPLTREQVIGRQARAKKVTVPDYGDYYTRTLSIREAIEMNDQIAKDKARAGSYLVAASLCDEDGRRLGMTVDDVDGLDVPVATTLLDVLNSQLPSADPEKRAQAAGN